MQEYQLSPGHHSADGLAERWALPNSHCEVLDQSLHACTAVARVPWKSWSTLLARKVMRSASPQRAFAKSRTRGCWKAGCSS